MPKRFALYGQLWLGRQLFEVAEEPKHLEVGESSDFDLTPDSSGKRALLYIDHPFETFVASVCADGIHVLSGDLWKVTGQRPAFTNKGDLVLISLSNYIVPHSHNNEKTDKAVYPPLLLSRFGETMLNLANGQPDDLDTYSFSPAVAVQKIIETTTQAQKPLESPLVYCPK